MKTFRILSLGLLSSSLLCAAGYKIPQQSLKSTALGGAYVANAHGADAAYFNPANMVFFSKEKEFELNLMYAKTSAIKFEADNQGHAVIADGVSEKENAFLSHIHYVHPSSNKNIVYGFSLAIPAGIAKRWNSQVQAGSAKKFELKIIEVNPSIGYKLNENFSIGAGIRFLKSDGVLQVNGDGTLSNPPLKLEGDTIDYGYNLAASYISNLANFAITYRSNVDIKLDGDALINNALKDGGSVEVPLPATLTLATSKRFGNFTAEFLYERNYWSRYKELKIDFDTQTDKSQAKNWKDSNTYRLGLTYDYEDWKFMVGYAIDKSPIPSSTLGFETPDSDADIYSLGFSKKLNKDASFGLAYLVSVKEDRALNTNVAALSGEVPGEITDSKAELFSVNYNFKF